MTKSFGNVERAFEAEAEEAFAFLTTDFGLDAPRRDGIVIPTVTFAGPGPRYRVMLATDDRAVVISIHLDQGRDRLSADLDEVAAAAGLTSPNQIRSSAHTLYALRGALRFQADLVRRLHPLLTAPSAADLIRSRQRRSVIRELIRRSEHPPQFSYPIGHARYFHRSGVVSGSFISEGSWGDHRVRDAANPSAAPGVARRS